MTANEQSRYRNGQRSGRTAARITLVGKGGHIELWPSEQWERHVAEAMPRYGDDLLDAGDGLNPALQDDK